MLAVTRMRLVFKIAGALAALYLVLIAALWAAMRQPPDRFSRFMARMPMPAMLVLPFQPLWMSARAGHLRDADPAPDFDLETLDHKGRVRLSSFRGGKPVVLVFGSYT